MGYRSDVYLKTTKDGYKALEQEIKKNSQAGYELFTTPDKLLICPDGKDIIMEWDFIKWYPEYDAVKAIDDAIYAITITYPLHFVRIGEDIDDIEDRFYFRDTARGTDFESLGLIRTVYTYGEEIKREDL